LLPGIFVLGTLAPLPKKHIASMADRRLGCFGKALQQPWQRDFQPGVILRDIQVTGRCLPQRAYTKKQAIAVPSFLVDLENRYSGGRTRQPRLEAALGFFTAKAMGN
jgi:hypothetical protein